MIELIIGPMMSGKSTELLRRLERSNIAGKKVCLIRPKIDNRDYFTHSGLNINIDVFHVKSISTIKNLFNYDVIGIDEGQFFTNIATSAYIINSELNKKIIISALNADFNKKMFPEIVSLIPYCDTIDKMNAVCLECGSDYGNYSIYTGEDVNKDEIIKIGGKESYKVVCFNCLQNYF